MLRWNSAFFEVFETASGWFWYLRMPDDSCIAQSSKHYPSLDAAMSALQVLPGAIDAAINVRPLIGLKVTPTSKASQRGDKE